MPLVKVKREWVVEWSLILVGGAFVLNYGDALWRHMVPIWPGGGYGFGAVAGLLFLTTWSVAGRAYRRARQLGLSGKAAGFWCLSSTAWAVGMFSTAAILSLIPGRNGRLLGSIGQDQPMWVVEHPEAWWAIAIGLATGAAAVMVPRGTGRRRQSREW